MLRDDIPEDIFNGQERRSGKKVRKEAMRKFLKLEIKNLRENNISYKNIQFI